MLRCVLRLTGKTEDDWKKSVEEMRVRLKEQANEQAEFWLEKKEQFSGLDRDTAIRMLIDALKIDSKISVIKRTGDIK